ncbi:MAG TPA: aminoglycoside phosphotransferase family protein [Microlunatus sp.]|nr:aminoglycoside phosphotransferase family protein [Microlunatus sp.]
MIEIPAGFRAMPRWWSDGSAWLDTLPASIERWCERWSLVPDGAPRYGSNALVLPVRREGEALALRLTPAGPEVDATIAALEFWAGRGTVELIASDPAGGVMLLERLDADRSLASRSPEEALPELGRTMRRLAVRAPANAPDTGEMLRLEAAGWTERWRELGAPLPGRDLDHVLAEIEPLFVPAVPELAVDGDLHAEQVLGGTRQPWLVVDPVLLRGDLGYDTGRLLWTRLDELGTDVDLRRWVRVIADAAGLDHDRTRRWVLARSLSYYLWGLERGLTDDPPRCRRLLAVFVRS